MPCRRNSESTVISVKIVPRIDIGGRWWTTSTRRSPETARASTPRPRPWIPTVRMTIAVEIRS
jgi:hypothetical protein